MEKLILDLLRFGETCAIPAKTLCEKIGADDRLVRKAIHNLRMDGYPILASQCGYFLPSPDQRGVEEAQRFLRAMRRRGASTFASLRCARRFLANHNQLEFRP